MKTRMMSVAAASVCAAVALGGQPPAEKPPEQPAPAKPATPPTSVPPASMPSLDEALGLTKPSDKPKTPPTPADGKPALPSDLDKALNSDGAAPANELERAVALMEQSAGRLEKSKDTSLDTQRVQEETVRLLDTLLKKSGQKKNQQNKNQQKPQDQQQEQKQQPSQSQQSQEQQRPQQGNDPSNDPQRGGNTNAQMRPGIDAARAAWGNLPQRVRQLLMQGSGDSFSKEYQRLTEEYYKRLGEQGN